MNLSRVYMSNTICISIHKKNRVDDERLIRLETFDLFQLLFNMRLQRKSQNNNVKVVIRGKFPNKDYLKLCDNFCRVSKKICNYHEMNNNFTTTM